jgi:hypothetical protein
MAEAAAQIDVLTAALLRDPSLATEAVLALDIFMSTDRYLAAEIVANALGRSRSEVGLRGLIAACDGLAVTRVVDALQLDRLLLALVQTPPGGSGDACSHAFSRFASLTRPVAEPFVREYLLERMERLASMGAEELGASPALARCALGFCVGTMADADAERYMGLLEDATDPTQRDALLFALRYTRNDRIEEWVVRELASGKLTGQELRRFAEAGLAQASADVLGALEVLLRPGSFPETVREILVALPYGRSPEGDPAGLVRRIRAIIKGDSEEWPADLRVLAVDAYREYLLGFDLDRDAVRFLRSALCDPAVREDRLRRSLRECVKFLGPENCGELVSLLRDGRIPVDEQVDLVTLLRASGRLLSSQRAAMMERIASDPSVPLEIRLAASTR